MIREIEATLASAAALRAESARLSLEASRVESEARRAAVEALGEALGGSAFDLARASFPDAPPPPAPAAAQPPQPPAAPPAREERPERPRVMGVEIPPGRVGEADEVVRQARVSASQGHKTNPFAGDRGKNAWRRKLFATALEAAFEADASGTPATADAPAPAVAGPERDPAPEPEADPAGREVRLDGDLPTAPPAVPAAQRAPRAAPAPVPDADPLDDLDATPAAGGYVSPPGYGVSRPADPGRRLGFGNAVPKPDGLDEGLAGREPPPAEAPPPVNRRFGPRPSFLNR